jgi:hypothetical protein
MTSSLQEELRGLWVRARDLEQDWLDEGLKTWRSHAGQLASCRRRDQLWRERLKVLNDIHELELLESKAEAQDRVLAAAARGFRTAE